MSCPATVRFALALAVIGPLAGADSADDRLDRTEITHLFSQAKDLFRQANDLADREPEAARDLYRQAAMRFERIARDGGVRNGKLYYNIANAYIRMGDLGRAILHYRRAQRLIPNDPNLRQNLAHARRQRVDQIETKQETRVLKTLFFWHYDTSTRARLALFAVCFGLLWAFAIARRFVPRARVGWAVGLFGGLAALLFGSLLAEEMHDRWHTGGVVLADEVTARKGDSETYQPSFEEPLHAGTEFELVEARRGWYHIELSDGRRCWVPAKATGLIDELIE